MAEQKRKLSKLCLAGFIISILSPVLLVLDYLSEDINPTIFWTALPVILLLQLAGFVLSIIGLVTACKKRRKGKGFGIAGIALPYVLTTTVVIIVVFFGGLILWGTSKTLEDERNSDLTSMGGIWTPVNTDCDVSQYRLTRDFDLDSLDIIVSESELKTYSESKLQEISDIDSIRAKGRFRNYNFIIVRTDCINDWTKDDPLASITYTNEGYATIWYSQSWEFMAATTYKLDVYKDPSDNFIIITNCEDYQVISEFFG